MIKRNLTCTECGAKTFSVQMRYLKKDELTLLYCHDGIGFEFSEAYWKCTKCGKESKGAEKTGWEEQK